MSIFLERFVIPVFVAGLGYLLYQSKLDTQSKISLGVVLVALAYFVGHSIELQKTKDAKEGKEQNPTADANQSNTVGYVGRVTTEAGMGIANALVLVNQDEKIGQSIRTDVNGQFQVQLPTDTKSLRLIASADGYVPATVQANMNRTGPEEIVLRLVTPKEKPSMPKAPDAKTPLSPPSAASPAPSPPAPVPPPPTTNNGIIINAPNFGNQNNIINPVPPVPEPPETWFTQSEYPASMGLSSPTGTPNTVNAGLLKIGVGKSYDNPIFYIECDSPCTIDKPLIGRRSGSSEVMTNGLHISRLGSTADGMHHVVEFEERLSPSAFAALRIRFSNPSGKVLSVTSTPPRRP